MKKRFTYLTIMIVSMLFTITSCSVDWDDILNDNNLMENNVEVYQLDYNECHVDHPVREEKRDMAIYSCYNDKADLGDKYSIDEDKLLEWNNKTLVIAHVFYHATLGDFTTKVYQKDGKYVIEILEDGIQYDGGFFRTWAFDIKSFAIILDKSGVKSKDIRLKVGILDCNQDGKRFHEFLETSDKY